MRWLDGARLAVHALAWRIRVRLTRRDREAELDEEIHAHLALLAEEHRRRGLSEAEAQRAARRDFGGPEQVREACRDLRRAPILDTIAADLRYAWRALRRQPGFTAAAVATFALGIGASTAIYTVIHEAVLAPLPFPKADGIVWVVNSWHGALGGLMNVEYQAWERQSRSFSCTAVYATRQVTLAGAGSAERVSAGTVSARFFSILGVAPALGRDFRPGEDEVGRERVALLSDGLWRRRFGGDTGVVGRSLVLDGEDYRVAGVLPRGFRFLEHEQPALFVPYALQSTRPKDGLSISQVNVIGRLRPGATAAAAESELRSILERSRHEYPLSALSYLDADRPLVRVVSARQWRSAGIGTAPFVLAGAVAVLLLIACANVANLQLARFLDRRQELAVRAALGAGRARLVQQLVTESLVLAALGGLFALVLAHASLQLAGRLAPESLGYLREVRLQPATLAFASLLVMLAGVLAGTLPALVGTPDGARHTLQQGTPRHTQGRAARLWAQGFTALTLALAVVLLVGSGLLARSFLRLTGVRHGFEPAGLLTLRVALPIGAYGDRAAVQATSARLVSELETLPGVEAAGLSDVGPLGFCNGYPVEVEGRAPRPGLPPSVCEQSVSARYLQLLGVRVLRGRLFREDEGRGTDAVAVINETARRQFFGSGDGVGARLRARDQWLTVVGVIADTRAGRDDPGQRPALFQPFAQTASTLMNAAGMLEWARGRPEARFMRPTATDLVLLMRSQPATHPASLANMVRERIARIDRDLVVHDLATMEERLASTVAGDRFLMALLAAFAAVALTLALVGVYGVTSYGVARRTTEIGVRVALGASRRSVLGLVLGQSARAAVIAVAAGLGLALALGRFLRAMLYETSPDDPPTLAVVAASVLAVALLAAALPAWGATAVDPAAALRHE